MFSCVWDMVGIVVVVVVVVVVLLMLGRIECMEWWNFLFFYV